MDMHKNYETHLHWIISVRKELLGVNNIKEQDDFFDLGADSLTVIRLFSRIERQYGSNKITIDQLFEQSRLNEIALLLYSHG